jgi:hypothetical protein
MLASKEFAPTSECKEAMDIHAPQTPLEVLTSETFSDPLQDIENTDGSMCDEEDENSDEIEYDTRPMPRAYVIGTVLMIGIALFFMVWVMFIEWSLIRITFQNNTIEYQLHLRDVHQSYNNSPKHTVMSYSAFQDELPPGCHSMTQRFFLASEQTIKAMIVAYVSMIAMFLSVFARYYQKIGNNIATTSWILMSCVTLFAISYAIMEWGRETPSMKMVGECFDHEVIIFKRYALGPNIAHVGTVLVFFTSMFSSFCFLES